MVISRRQFISMAMGVAVAGPYPVFSHTQRQELLSCRSNFKGEHFFTMFDVDGRILWDLQLPDRGHGISVDNEQRRAGVFGRRPGEYVWILDLDSRRILHKIDAISGRHFYGHGVFAANGTRLLCSENAYETGEGVIGVYDTHNRYKRIDEFRSYGIGPHEIKMLNDGKTLVVANGGIQTHPDLPRIKTNLDTMRPNLAYVDSETGNLLHSHEPEIKWHQLSIRHIDISPRDTVAIAMQFEGEPHLLPPVIAIHQGEQELKMLYPPQDVQHRLNNYCGSVAFSGDGDQFAVSSPRGGLVTYWSESGDYLGEHDQIDACGVCPARDREKQFLVSSGVGKIARIGDRQVIEAAHQFSDSRWDNHMLAVYI